MTQVCSLTQIWKWRNLWHCGNLEILQSVVTNFLVLGCLRKEFEVGEAVNLVWGSQHQVCHTVDGDRFYHPCTLRDLEPQIHDWLTSPVLYLTLKLRKARFGLCWREYSEHRWPTTMIIRGLRLGSFPA